MEKRKKRIAGWSEEIKRITDDYEALAKEQKDRIITLREENRTLQSQLEEHEANHKAVAEALVRAQQAAQDIIRNAERESDKIVQRARHKEARSEMRIQNHRLMLGELAERCENILHTIENELDRSSHTFAIEVYSGSANTGN